MPKAPFEQCIVRREVHMHVRIEEDNKLQKGDMLKANDITQYDT